MNRRKHYAHWVVGIFVIAAFGAIHGATAAVPNPTTFVVTKTADTADGTCDADCSLREAVIAANANYGDDTITLPAGNYDFTISGRGEDAAATGDLDITENLVINGNSSGDTRVDAKSLDRAFQVMSGSTVELHDISVWNGVAANTGASGFGGGVYTEGTLSVYDCAFMNNIALSVPVTGSGGSGYGGAIYNDGFLSMVSGTTFEANYALYNRMGPAGGYGGAISNSGAITEISDSIFRDNWAAYNNSTHQTSGYGGAIQTTGGITTIDGTRFEGNIASETSGGGTSQGGAIFMMGVTISTISDSDFTNNTALINTHPSTASNGYGGAIYVNGTITTMEQVTMTGNTAKSGSGAGDGLGGGMAVIDTVSSIEDLTMTGNTAVNFTGSGAAIGYGGGLYVDGTVTDMHRAQFSDNVAKTGVGNGSGYGGGIFDVGQIVSFKNSTVSGNTALEYTGSDNPNGLGGGIYTVGSSSVYDYLTMTDNTATQNMGSGTPTAAGGGMYSTGQLFLGETVIGGNTDGNATPTSPDCYSDGGITSNGYNIIADITGCNYSHGTGDHTNVHDAVLGALADNGGFNQTNALLTGSPAIDAIPAASCSNTEDQRGYARPENTDCDSGAYEFDQTDPVLTLTGSASQQILINETYNDPGATATDNFDGNITSQIVKTGTVNNQKTGTYTLAYTVTDTDGNSDSAQRTVKVVSRGDVVNVTPLKNGRVKVKYEDDSTQTFTLFTQGTLKPRAKLSKNGKHIVAVHRNGSKMKSIDAVLGTTITSLDLFSNKQEQLKLQLYNYYSSTTNNDVIVVGRRGGTMKTYHFFVTKNGKLTNKDGKTHKSSYKQDTYLLIKREKLLKLKKENGTLLVKYKVRKDGDLKEL